MKLLKRFALLFQRRQFESAMSDEFESHIHAYVEELMRSGVPRNEAERQARIEFGNVNTLKEECRQSRGLHWVDEFRQDFLYALRSMRKNWGFTSIVVSTTYSNNP
jgi:hypothetical protein